jgi:hypothetical protein
MIYVLIFIGFMLFACAAQINELVKKVSNLNELIEKHKKSNDLLESKLHQLVSDIGDIKILSQEIERYFNPPLTLDEEMATFRDRHKD